MKIRILTFSSAMNYGALLQTYALSQVLKNEGYSVELYRISLFKSPLKAFICRHFYARFVKKFQNKYLPPFVDLKVKSDADCYIVGSDQVWNSFYIDNWGFTFFFDFLQDSCKRIAYAASFGEDNWMFPEDIKINISTLLKKFSHISLREKSSVVRFEKEFGIVPKVVLDPTLLLINYREITGDTISRNTLVSFKFNQTPMYYVFLKKMSEKLNLKIIRLDARYLKFKGKEYINRYYSVSIWVKEIAQSKFVITDSFHGMVFAILHKRQFIVLPSSSSKNGRILSLLDSLGIKERYYTSYEEVLMDERWKTDIDYRLVEEKLEGLRMNSLLFLKEAVEAC